MARIRNEPAYVQAIRQWGVPECLHVPIVALDEEAIADHIGDIVEVISPGRALLVEIDPPPPRDERLPIWEHPLSSAFFERRQVWVSHSYSRYRYAYVKAFGPESVAGKVLAHMYNRRMAALRGYKFIRLVPVSRGANSSSSFTEQWGVQRSESDLGARREKLGLRMQYADLGDLMVMLDIQLGGGVQEVFRVGQDLIEVPGNRPPQAEA
jgi:hypothetical protein